MLLKVTETIQEKSITKLVYIYTNSFRVCLVKTKIKKNPYKF